MKNAKAIMSHAQHDMMTSKMANDDSDSMRIYITSYCQYTSVLKLDSQRSLKSTQAGGRENGRRT